ncbi:phage holin family protein [Rubrivirga sp. S365]|uniref:Phage holin family protein n=1 Tax=Rubrivirga litoralis TaxID=3075598 RepID=A0ABU3BTC1_9BACT|nr:MULTISPECIES: phage holin family protein [unclassified Rubrivirga]MDT0632530.1 phage holin family protein [Rubrivirga sp. F394]MDT7856995.1 phage holin family protein [Rubrivirga sp. S365]
MAASRLPDDPAPVEPTSHPAPPAVEPPRVAPPGVAPPAVAPPGMAPPRVPPPSLGGAPRGVPPGGGADVVPESRQLPPHQGKLARIGDHVSSLSTDLKEWVELRIDLAKAEVREAIDKLKASLKRKGIAIGYLAAAGVLALYGLGFLLGALAWGLAALFESVWLGMLVTALLLFVVVGVLAWIGKRKLDEDQAIEARARVSKITESDQINPGAPTVRSVQEAEADKARAAAV